MTFRLIVLFCLATLFACADGPPSHIAEVTLAHWALEPTLPKVSSDGDCARLTQLQVECPDTEAAYLRRCPPNSWACQRWDLTPGRALSRYRPVAVMNPALPRDRVVAHVVHEFLHAVSKCAKKGFVDYPHADPRAWRPAPDSVEALVVQELYDTPIRDPCPATLQDE